MSEKNTQQLDEVKVFKDPVHGQIHVRDRLIWNLIQTAEFQRLRRIRQLGTTYFTFHGAEHSRFTHSLGVYEIVRRIVDEEWKSDLPPLERMVALCSALLHDLGHGPFSHSFEKVFHLDHEAYTREILLGDTEIHACLQTYHPDLPEKVAQVIAKTYGNPVIVSLISSQIDADRMDYLLRDAYFSGVSYGNFDLDRILRVMQKREDKGGIAFKKSGLHAIEDYLMSRYQMYIQIYFHPVTRSAEIILSKIFQRAKYLFQQSDYHFGHLPEFVEPFLSGDVMLTDYLRLDEYMLGSCFVLWMEEQDEILQDLCARFVNRKLFQYVDYQREREEDQGIYTRLTEIMRELSIDPDYYLDMDESSNKPYTVLPKNVVNESNIYIKVGEGKYEEIEQMSKFVQFLTETYTDVKLFYPEDLILERAKDNPKIRAEMQRLRKMRD